MKTHALIATVLLITSLTIAPALAQNAQQGERGGAQAGAQQMQQQQQRQQQRQGDRAMSQQQNLDHDRLQTRERNHTQVQARDSQGAAEGIYGGNLMTVQERSQYREQLGAFATDPEREAFRARHRERMQLRAKQRGIEPETTTD